MKHINNLLWKWKELYAIGKMCTSQAYRQYQSSWLAKEMKVHSCVDNTEERFGGRTNPVQLVLNKIKGII